MTSFALVQEAEIEIPDEEERPSKSLQENLARIYRSYAAIYPNPRLIEENKQRDTLSRALSAANEASRLNPPSKKSGFFSTLFGGGGSKPAVDDEPQEQESEETGIHLVAEIEHGDGDGEFSPLCGTQDSLDVSCIPEEAHSMARFHVSSSTRFSNDRPNVAQRAWERPGTSIMVVTGLGEFIEYSLTGNKDPEVQHTADRDDLRGYDREMGQNFLLEYVRFAIIGPNLLVVSWGMPDGCVVFYRRLVGGETVRWWPFSSFSPSSELKEDLGDLFMDEGGCSLLRVTGLAPMAVETNEAPAASLAVSRLGGSIEVIPLDPRMWYGPEIQPGKKLRKRKLGLHPPDHYACGKLKDVGDGPMGIVAFKTLEYHSDVIGLEVFRTSLRDDLPWDPEMYPNGPPAEYVLVAYGARDSCETVTFWSVSTLFNDSSSSKGSPGFSLHVSLVEVIDVDLGNCSATVFADNEIMKYWRKAKSVELVESSKGEKKNPISTISVAAPIAFLSFRIGQDRSMVALHDSNGGTKVLDITLLDRSVAQALSDKEFELIDEGNRTGEIVPLVSSIYGRTQFSSIISTSNSDQKVNFSSNSIWLGQEDSLSALLAVDVLASSSIGLVTMTGSRASSAQILSDVPRSLNLVPSPMGRQGCKVVARTRGSGSSLYSFLSLDQTSNVNLIQFLYQEQMFEKVLEVASEMTPTQRLGMSRFIDQSILEAWKASGNKTYLKDVSDPELLYEEALGVDLKTCDPVQYSEFLLLAIQNPSFEVPKSPELLELQSRLIERLVKTRTYELLCLLRRVEPSGKNLDLFLRMSIRELLWECTRELDWGTFSVLFFRHFDEVDVELYDCLPISGAVIDWLHLFPVVPRNGVPHFLASESVEPFEKFPFYMEQKGIKVTIDYFDLECVLNSINTTGLGREFSWIPKWYLERTRCALSHFGDLALGLHFTDLAFFSLNCDESINSDSGGKDISALKAGINTLLSILAKMDDRALFDGEWMGYQPGDLDSLSPSELISILVNSGDTENLLSNLRALIAVSGVDPSLLIATLTEFSFSAKSEVYDLPNQITRLIMLIKLSVAASSLSPLKESVAESLVLAAMKWSALLDHLDLGTVNIIVNELWSLFELLPVDNDSPTEETSFFLKTILALTDILGSWPCRNVFFHHDLIVSSANFKSVQSFEALVCLIQESYENQLTIVRSRGSYDPSETTVLSFVVKDIQTMSRVLGIPEDDARKVTSRRLFPFLLSKGETGLIQFLLEKRGTTLDLGELSLIWERFSKDVLSGKSGNLESVIELETIFGSVFPEKLSSLGEIESFINCAHFVNTTIVPYTKLDPVNPEEIRRETSIDYILSLLRWDCSVLTFDCKEWEADDGAQNLNERIRAGWNEFVLPGSAIFRILEILERDHDLVDTLHIIIAWFLMENALYGAAVAVLRNLHFRLKPRTLPVAALSIMVNLVSSTDYSDEQSKLELAELLLFTQRPTISRIDGGKFVDSLNLLRGLDYAGFLGSFRPSSCVPSFLERLCQDLAVHKRVAFLPQILEINLLINESTYQDLDLSVVLLPTAEWCLGQRGSSSNSNSFILNDLCFGLEFLISGVAFEDSLPRNLMGEFHVGEITEAQDSSGSYEVQKDLITKLIGRGYSRNAATRSVKESRAKEFNQALQWAVAHSLDSNLDSPWIETATTQNEASFTAVMTSWLLRSGSKLLLGDSAIKEKVANLNLTDFDWDETDPPELDQETPLNDTLSSGGGELEDSFDSKVDGAWDDFDNDLSVSDHILNESSATIDPNAHISTTDRTAEKYQGEADPEPKDEVPLLSTVDPEYDERFDSQDKGAFATEDEFNNDISFSDHPDKEPSLGNGVSEIGESVNAKEEDGFSGTEENGWGEFENDLSISDHAEKESTISFEKQVGPSTEVETAEGVNSNEEEDQDEATSTSFNRTISMGIPISPSSLNNSSPAGDAENLLEAADVTEGWGSMEEDLDLDESRTDETNTPYTTLESYQNIHLTGKNQTKQVIQPIGSSNEDKVTQKFENAVEASCHAVATPVSSNGCATTELLSEESTRATEGDVLPTQPRDNGSGVDTRFSFSAPEASVAVSTPQQSGPNVAHTKKLDVSAILKDRPKIEKKNLVPTTFSSTMDIAGLKDRGKEMFQSSRAASLRPIADERRRLIEEGRRLLQQAKSSTTRTTQDSPPIKRTHHYNLRSTPARATKPAPPPPQETVQSKADDSFNEGWDFDAV